MSSDEDDRSCYLACTRIVVFLVLSCTIVVATAYGYFPSSGFQVGHKDGQTHALSLDSSVCSRMLTFFNPSKLVIYQS